MTPQPGEKPWALWVAMLYAAALAVMTLPMLVASFLGRLGDIDCPRLFLAWQYWAWLVVMGAAQWALLRVPVRVASKRPTTRGPVLVTILASGLMAGALVAAGIGSLYEFATRLEGAPDWIGWVGWLVRAHRSAIVPQRPPCRQRIGTHRRRVARPQKKSRQSACIFREDH